MTGTTKMIPLNPDRYTLGRHETIPVRFGSLTKRYQAWCENPNVLEDKAKVRLGVGRDMASVVKYWLIVAQAVQS
ncbi:MULTISPECIES: DUF4007 family protein [unclassified Methylocaldum]|jgi:hypothetical protein|uniref:DUF4007 family protein n=1 Tax=unclassified Methylocaldum TaxID=2622260 RepID=UPI00098B1DF7|nr:MULTISPECIES: DUF4007 family protein [unclassified Methylocaldum]MBP1149444.1 hypothetical protein [Methylocaldum sp. RMAD-M]